MALPTTISPQGATVTFATSGWTSGILGFSLDGQERPVKDVTNLATTTYRQKKPGSLVDPGSVTMSFQLDPDNLPPISSAAELMTIEWPAPSGYESGAKLSGTGFVSAHSFDGTGGDEEEATGELTFTFDGNTGPAFSDASATVA